MSRCICTVYILLFLFACKKVEIKEVAVDKIYSWTEIKRFTGVEKIFLSSGSSADAIYLQQPYYFTEVKHQNIHTGITVYAASPSSDIGIRAPITSNYAAFPYSDTILKVINNTAPAVSPSGGYFNLKQIDPTLTAIQKYYNILFKCMSINKNGTLLFAYYNNRPSQPFTFMLFKIKTNVSYPYADTLFTKVVTIPGAGLDGYVRHIASVNDYFLIDISASGLYKIKEDGTFNKVHNPATIDAFYEWKGKVYAHAEWDKLLISEDNGDTWQQFSGTNSSMTTSNYYIVKDSLVGAYRDNLFTLSWNGPNYIQRFLKSDGMEATRINGVEALRDSIFVATTSGLFVKSAATFFESK